MSVHDEVTDFGASTLLIKIVCVCAGWCFVGVGPQVLH